MARPYGTALLIAGVDETGTVIYHTGLYYYKKILLEQWLSIKQKVLVQQMKVFKVYYWNIIKKYNL